MYLPLLRYFAFLIINLLSITAAAQTTTEYNNQAKLANDKKDYEAVINFATLSLNVNLNGVAFWWRAIGYYNKKNYPLAISDVTKAIPFYSSAKSSLGNLYVLRADAKYFSYNYDGAIDDYELALINEVSDKKRIYYNLIKAYETLQDYDGVIPYYDNIIRIELNSLELSNLYYKRGVAKSQGHNYSMKNIVEDLDMSIKFNKQNVDALYARGATLFEEKNYNSVKADFLAVARILETKSKNHDDTIKLKASYNSIAAIFYEARNYEEAKLYYQKVLRFDQSDGFVYWNLGRLKAALGNAYDSASLDFKKAIGLINDKSNRAKCYIDWYLHERKYLKFNKALDALEGAILMNPNDYLNYWDKANLFNLKNEPDEALKYYNKALELGIKDTSQRAAFYLETGLFKLKMNDVQGALLDIQRSIGLRPSYDNYMALGKVFKIGMKQNDLANGNFQKAMAYAVSSSQKNDTSSNYAYAAAAMGDKITGERFIKKMILDASAKVGALANEYHNAACIYTTLGNFPKALEYLELSLQSGYSDFEHMLFDADLEPLYKLPEYKNLLLKYKLPSPVF